MDVRGSLLFLGLDPRNGLGSFIIEAKGSPEPLSKLKMEVRNTVVIKSVNGMDTYLIERLSLILPVRKEKAVNEDNYSNHHQHLELPFKTFQ